MDQWITTSFKPFFAEALGIMSIDKIIDWGLENNNKYSISFLSPLYTAWTSLDERLLARTDLAKRDGKQ